MSFSANHLGSFSSIVEVQYSRLESNAEAQSSETHNFKTSFNVTASVADHTIELLTSRRAPLPSRLDLGTKYYGEFSVYNCIVVNKGPKAVKFQSVAGTAQEMSMYLSQGNDRNASALFNSKKYTNRIVSN